MDVELAEAVHLEPSTAAQQQQQQQQQQQSRKFQHKRKRHYSTDCKQGGRGGGRHNHWTPHKKPKPSVSSTHAAEHVMKYRLGGSVSDPLNLEGGDIDLGDDCSTCAPSPVTGVAEEDLPTSLPPQLQKDPLNLEGKVKNFPLTSVVGGTGKERGNSKAATAAGQRRKPRRRTTSGSKPDDIGPCSANRKNQTFRYGNYNRYYGYRNNGVNEVDPRLALLHRDWMEGMDCLDIGCNTGQVTIAIAKDFNPRSIVGVDIDPKLINTAWKNLHRSYAPPCAPDGRPFPASLTLARGPIDFPPVPSDGPGSSQDAEGRPFPQNIRFVHENYVPKDDTSAQDQVAEYDVILALSLTKWIHLNWGDNGIKRFFKKVYNHLRPGGCFIVEPQPFSSYSKKKKITAEVFKNYQSITFRPKEFHSYLLSSEVGFSAHQFLGVPDNKSRGFQRAIHMYMKDRSPPLSTAQSQHPVADGCRGGGGGGGGGGGRGTKDKFKSVVVVPEDKIEHHT